VLGGSVLDGDAQRLIAQRLREHLLGMNLRVSFSGLGARQELTISARLN